MFKHISDAIGRAIGRREKPAPPEQVPTVNRQAAPVVTVLGEGAPRKRWGLRFPGTSAKAARRVKGFPYPGMDFAAGARVRTRTGPA